VYCVRCGGNGRVWIKSTKNMTGQRNSFQFSQSNGLCPSPEMRLEWHEYGKESFVMTVLEELEKKETQTDAQFADELAVLLEMWREKLEQDALEE
jgi:exosome complex RNA-binding protein Rrp4